MVQGSQGLLWGCRVAFQSHSLPPPLCYGGKQGPWRLRAWWLEAERFVGGSKVCAHFTWLCSAVPGGPPGMYKAVSLRACVCVHP